jgi:dTMP kinase
LWPDLVILLDVDPVVAAARVSAAGGGPDRIEAEGTEFHSRVAAGFRSLAAADRSWVVVDGSGTVDEVLALVQAAVHSFFD